MTDEPEQPDERTITTADGDEVTVRETIEDVTVSASRKIQLDQYEPIEGFTSLTAQKPGDLETDAFHDWLETLADIAWFEAERSAMGRYEQYVREEAFGDD